MQSSGYIQRMTEDFRISLKEDERKLDPIALPQVTVPFLIFGTGLVFSLLILSIEMIFHQRRGKPHAMKRKQRRVLLRKL